MPSTVPITVAIPCYRNEESLKTTLGHIFNCDPLPQEVLLHFDGGWEPRKDFSCNTPVPVRILCSKQNLGPGGGRDLLFKEAACDLICSFDDDSWPLDSDFFEQTCQVMGLFPDAAVMSPAVYLREKPKLPRLAEVNESGAFDGSASITRRSHYLKLPGYVPVSAAYGVEEVDLSLQAHAAGFQVLHCPWLRAWHDRPYADNQHSILPWIRNEVLFAYLRYPFWFQPWGWLRAIRHVVGHFSMREATDLIYSLLTSPAHCEKHRHYVRHYTMRDIWQQRFRKRRSWTLDAELDRRVATPLKTGKRILYLQYTNPAAYPPLQHSSQILAARGWEICFLGVSGRGSAQMAFPPFPRIKVMQMNWCAPGFRQKLHYLLFAFKAAWKALYWRPDWIYCSDPLSAPLGRLVSHLIKTKIVYHEHDSPDPMKAQETWFSRFCERQRRLLMQSAAAVVVPNQARLEALLKLHPTHGKSFCVWNVPAKSDLPELLTEKQKDQPLRILYHGSIVPDRFPIMMLEALAAAGQHICLRLIGYEVPGMIGYTEILKTEAQRLGISHRFEYLGTIPQRSDLMARCAECDVGLSLLNHRSKDINMRHMVGASNKPFDYLSQGLALIVSRESEWEALYVQEGCAVACELESVEELTQVFQWLADHRPEVAAMGERGRQLIAIRWNYECQFQPLVELMEKL